MQLTVQHSSLSLSHTPFHSMTTPVPISPSLPQNSLHGLICSSRICEPGGSWADLQPPCWWALWACQQRLFYESHKVASTGTMLVMLMREGNRIVAKDCSSTPTFLRVSCIEFRLLGKHAYDCTIQHGSKASCKRCVLKRIWNIMKRKETWFGDRSSIETDKKRMPRQKQDFMPII